MGILQRQIMESTSVAMSETSSAYDVEKYGEGSIVAKITSNNPSNTTFDTGTMEVQTFTFPTKAAATNGDYVRFYDQSGTAWAVALTKPVAEVQTLTFPAVAASTGGDYVVLTDGSGLTWAISLNKSGADPEPTGAAWVAVAAGRKVHVDISGGTDAASVAALVETAFDALTGATSAITTDDSAADGTMLLTMVAKAPCANPDPHNANDSGVGSITGVETTAGIAAQTPTGAIWTAIAAGNKCLADISGDTTAAQVAARVETAVDAMTGFTAVIVTDDSANNGTMLFTQVVPGPTSDATPKSFDDAGAGSITIANTTQGVAGEVNITDNKFYIPGHGYTTGMKITELTTTTTLPAPLNTGTAYYAIRLDDDYISFATSQANALAGTAINITDYGATTGVHTVSVATTLAGTIKFQTNIEPSGDTANWVDLSDEEVLNGNNSQTISAAGNLRWVLEKILFGEIRAVVTMTSGTVLCEIRPFLTERK